MAELTTLESCHKYIKVLEGNIDVLEQKYIEATKISDDLSMDELKKEIIELLFAYYEHGINHHTIVPNIDAEIIIKKIQQKLKKGE